MGWVYDKATNTLKDDSTGQVINNPTAGVPGMGGGPQVVSVQAGADPKAQQYKDLVQQMADANKQALQDQTLANRPNQFNPWGSTTWYQDGTGQWNQNVQLKQPYQDALDSQMQLGAARSGLGLQLFGNAKDALSSPMDWGKLPGLGSGEDARNNAENAIWGRETSRLDPMWNQRQSQMQTQLANQGLEPGSEAYTNAMRDFNNSRNDAYQQANYGAIMGGGQEASRQYGLDLNRRQQGLSEMLGQRGQALNEVNALLGGQQVGMPSFPGFQGAGMAQTPNFLGAQQGADQFGLQQQQLQMAKDQADNGYWADIFKGGAGALGSIFNWLK